MNVKAKAAVVAALIVAVGVVIAAKNQDEAPQVRPEATPPSPDGGAVAGLPGLLELGSVDCIPCKRMKPILDELRNEYAGRLWVDFIDIRKDREAASAYGIWVMPTQILFDAAGNEIFRHEGVFEKEDILAKWKELGIDLNSRQSPASRPESPLGPDTPLEGAACCGRDGGVDAGCGSGQSAGACRIRASEPE